LQLSCVPRKKLKQKESDRMQVSAETMIKTTESADFYKSLETVSNFSQVLLEISFVPLPIDWTIVITDVIGSTNAIEAGRYKEVNALGVACIIGLTNAIPGIDLPFCFGGDGATLAIPTSMLGAVDCALRGLQKLAEHTFDLKLRTGRVSVAELEKAGHPVFVAKYSTGGPPIACFRGSGISVAEDWIKSIGGAEKYNPPPSGSDELNLHGFECRWKPAHNRNGIICSILIKARQSAEDNVVGQREAVYSTVFSKVEDLVGKDSSAISVSNLQLRDLSGDFTIEAKMLSKEIKGGWRHFQKLHRARMDALLGRILCYWKLNVGGFPGKTYLNDVARNTDCRKFDDALRMVVDISPESANELSSWLESQYQAGAIYYGLFCSESALITCMIHSYESDHLHFVDGADGGYALAAKGMKAQMKQASE
jgi:hypothetical protein